MNSFINTKTFTREDALKTMANILAQCDYIPSASIGEGGAGYCLIDPEFSIKAFAERVTRYNWSYRVVPVNEICDDIKANIDDLDNYDVCVEFTQDPDGSGNCYNPPREQFLLWDVD